MISIDQFKEIDIRAGKIISAEEIEGADKLLKLMVDIGEDEPRQIVSGIKEYFPSTETLVDKQILIVANLEPRTLRGVESRGMILAIKHKGGLALITPDQEVPVGLRVS